MCTGGGVVNSVIRSLQGCDARLCAASSESTMSAQPRCVSREDGNSGIITATRSVQKGKKSSAGTVCGWEIRDDVAVVLWRLGYANNDSGTYATLNPPGSNVVVGTLRTC